MAQPFETALLVRGLVVAVLAQLVLQQCRVLELAEQVVQALLQAFLGPLITMLVVAVAEIILLVHPLPRVVPAV
jgi:fructose-specific phosphotransferase system IIC component